MAKLSPEEQAEIDKDKAIWARLDAEGGWKGTSSAGSPNIQTNKGFPYVSRVPQPRDPFFKNHDSKGRCVVKNRQQEREFARQRGLEWD